MEFEVVQGHKGAQAANVRPPARHLPEPSSTGPRKGPLSFAKDEVDMAITREEVLHVAKLARLELTDDEVERLTGKLGAILEAVGKVAELDLADVPPTSHPLVARRTPGGRTSRDRSASTRCSRTRRSARATSSACRRPHDTLRAQSGPRRATSLRRCSQGGRTPPGGRRATARDRRVIDTLRLTAEEAIGLLERRRGHPPPSSTAPTSTRSPSATRSCTPTCASSRSRRATASRSRSRT